MIRKLIIIIIIYLISLNVTTVESTINCTSYKKNTDINLTDKYIDINVLTIKRINKFVLLLKFLLYEIFLSNYNVVIKFIVFYMIF